MSSPSPPTRLCRGRVSPFQVAGGYSCDGVSVSAQVTRSSGQEPGESVGLQSCVLWPATACAAVCSAGLLEPALLCLEACTPHGIRGCSPMSTRLAGPMAASSPSYDSCRSVGGHGHGGAGCRYVGLQAVLNRVAGRAARIADLQERGRRVDRE